MNANDSKFKIGCLILALCSQISVTSAGTVAQVNGTLANDAVLTITGTGFGSKSNPKPLYYWDFSSGTTLSSLSRGAYPGAMRGSLTSSQVAPGSRTSLMTDVAGITEAFGPTDGMPFSSNTLYVWAKKYYGFNIVADQASNGLNLKFFRLWFPFTYDIYTGYQGSAGAASGRTMAEVTSQTATYWQMPHESGKWIIDEWEYFASDIGVTNGVFNYTRGGISAYPRSTRFPTRDASHSALYNVAYFDQISNNLLSAGKYLYFDSIYVDETWQRVVISDEPTWQSAVYGGSGVERKREIQVPSAWNDTTIQITVRLGSLGASTSKYLYVIGVDGNPVNQTGFSLAAINSKVPMPPSGVK